MLTIKLLQFDEILPIWEKFLWPNRTTPIESHSAWLHPPGELDMKNFDLPVMFYGLELNGILVGVNSVHLCADNSARTRGLYVDPIVRGRGYGSELLSIAVFWAVKNNAQSIWSYPRKTAWPAYEAVGFKLTSDWQTSETSEANAYCYLELDVTLWC